ncbi:hypothetical protein SD70_02350 [Gordoniibacillus kamchatkensis]|uniref:HTH cro/C1-type domain-containing protein n=1 Tax=Gordoniibacillus kamchatkensis TaxID=1590651 RepID=A0ABR5ALX1_9BACL|nr:helix-turn-helix transcriptional regulator [Paenibacillus sp. VKM B-2647]KIL42047.1 hypothetical protein SD70_02350 [Paenibacillus sp. VKM B-2647]
MAYKVGRCLLQRRLQEAGMTQQDLANRINMSRQQVSDYATGVKNSMHLSTAKTIASAIGCSIDDLYEWIEIKPSKRSKRAEK